LDKFDGYLDEIYSAAFDPGAGWTKVCDLLARVSGGVGGAIVPWRRESRFADFPISNTIIPLVTEYQKESWYLRDTRDNGIPLFHKQSVFTEQHFMTRAEVDHDPMYQELLAKHRVMHGAIVKMATSDGLYCASIQRETERGNFSGAELAALETLSPHLARAASLSFRLGMEHARGSLAAFDQLGLAGCAINHDGEVVALNSATSPQLGQWYDIVAGHLHAKYADDDPALQRMIQSVGDLDSVTRNHVALDMVIRHPVTAKPILVQAYPVGHKANGFFSSVAAVLIFTDDNASAVPIGPHLQKMYGLTVAEARVSELLAQGMDVSEISEKLQNSVHTVRAHVKNIYGKTGDNSRASFVKRINSLKQKLIGRS